MRHLNFRIDEAGEFRSLDGFNRDKILTRALIGDSTATLKFPEVQWLFADYANYTVPGLPINDRELIRALDLVSPRCDRVFLFPATEMHGAIKLEEITRVKSLPWEERFLEYQGDDRYCVGNLHYLQVTGGDMDVLLVNYLEIIAGILEKYPNVYLVPIVNKFLGVKIRYAFRAYAELQKLERCLQLDWLDPNNSELWADVHGHLSRLGWTKLKAQLDEV
ncbi:hypothetical protein [Laspinema olomoucense]|uniref:hypothetical protein n=1 Tax=Laspinema olomoucense TaxID=3231600 RepID=UPI0021BAE08A|nr:hypothetical protein [Laspinema sp. D3a]MCT7988833.1 hypothetical protein [Laspinema sp. D3a]